jgi:hypothetical protein
MMIHGDFEDVVQFFGSFEDSGFSGTVELEGDGQTPVLSITHGLVTISITQPPPALPDNLWVSSVHWVRAPSGNPGDPAGLKRYRPAEQTLAGSCLVEPIGGNHHRITHFEQSGASSSANFGLEQSVQGRLIVLTSAGQAEIRGIAAWAEADGTPRLGALQLPALLPPAVKLGSDLNLFSYAGTFPRPGVAGGQVACYAQLRGQAPRWIEIEAAGHERRSASLEQPGGGQAQRIPLVFSTASRLFHVALANAPQMPQPLNAVTNPSSVLAGTLGAPYSLWRLQPPQELKLPHSLVVSGRPWWYAGVNDQGWHLYHGFIDGQQIRLGELDAFGRWSARLVDPWTNALNQRDPDQQTSGTYNPERHSIVFRDGTVAVSGNQQGGYQPVSRQDSLALHTIDGDLDILGNHLSFGLLEGDASLAGMLFRFTDLPAPSAGPRRAVLHQVLSRTRAEWWWHKAGSSASAPTEPVMHVGADHSLQLHTPGAQVEQGAVPHEGGNFGIRLNPVPGGTSSIPGVLRVRPGGDLSMGDFGTGTPP